MLPRSAKEGYQRARTRLDETRAHLLEEDAEPEPRWPAVLALLAASGVYAVLPTALDPFRRWESVHQWVRRLPFHRYFLLELVLVLLIPTFFTRLRGRHTLNRAFGLITAGIVTATIIVSIVLLITVLLTDAHASAKELLRSAAVLWLANVLVFALWYWHLDAGGPHQRDLIPGHCYGAFLFPQMTMTPEERKIAGQAGWSPGFVDYLFLAFNTSTALSPADTAALSRWAKCLMMLQSLLSLTLVALIAARAVNILS